jgi:hypothetical protein
MIYSAVELIEGTRGKVLKSARKIKKTGGRAFQNAVLSA